MSLYQTMLGSEQVYFDAAVSLLFFLLVGRFLDESLRVRARGEAQNLLSLQGAIATLIAAGGSRCQVPAHALRPGDRLLVAAGERVAADGVVTSGEGQIDQSLITGETAPETISPGGQVYAGTLNLTQPLQIEVTAADSGTLLAEISRLMLAAEQGKARYRRLADRAAQIYAPAVHGLGLATFLGWLLLGASWQTALTYAIAVLIITCPCALALAVPAVQIAAASRLFRQGIVVKSADGLERLAETDLVVFDKTGTLTLGRPQLLDDDPISDDALMAAARLASASKHPYARALVAAAEQRLGRVLAASGVEEDPGRGLKRVLAQGEERLGSAEWCGVDSTGEGSEVWYRRDWMAPVRFRFADVLRADAAETVATLKRDGYRRGAPVWGSHGRGRGYRPPHRHRHVARRAKACRQDRLARCLRQRRPQGADGGRRPQRRAGPCRGACLDLSRERRRYQPARRRLRVPRGEARPGARSHCHRQARAIHGLAELRRRRRI